jgi:hypothetical protein
MRSVRRPAAGIASAAPKPCGAERALAAGDLEVQRQDDHRPEQRAAEQERRRGGRREGAVAEQPDVDQRPRRPPRVHDERGDERDTGDDRPEHQRVAEAALRLGLRETEHDAGDPG